MAERVEPLIIVDAANVVGSRPDGWWRDRAAATIRLRDRLADLAATGVSRGPRWARRGPVSVVLVTEGRAATVSGSDTVAVVAAPGSGDDTIAELATAAAGVRDCLVVTSDRGLAARVRAVGGHVVGAGTLA